LKISRRKHEPSPKLESYRQKVAGENLVPLWERLGELLTEEPQIRSVPHIWRYDVLRPLLLESANLISAEQAERRVLILENPGLEGSSAATESLFAGLQLVMPGEIAPSHRHTPAALRFIIEGDGAYTAVDGEKLPMHVGDFIVTPSWRWHDHGHDGSGPFVWLDVLDLPTVRNACAIFFEEYPNYRYPESRASGDNVYRFGSNMRPVDYKPSASSPLLCFPYEQSRVALEQLKRHAAWDPCHALKMEFVDPTTGSAAIPTISTYIQLLPQGFSSEPYRSTEGTVFCVIEGRGNVTIGRGDARTELSYRPRDIVVVPCWQPHRFVVDDETVLFSASDRAAQMRLGLWRELRGGGYGATAEVE
jgi:gentisate 1,2-dioxygenase